MTTTRRARNTVEIPMREATEAEILAGAPDMVPNDFDLETWLAEQSTEPNETDSTDEADANESPDVGKPNISNPAEPRTVEETESQTDIGNANGTDQSPENAPHVPTASEMAEAEYQKALATLKTAEARKRLANVNDLVIGILNAYVADKANVESDLVKALASGVADHNIDVVWAKEPGVFRFGRLVPAGATKTQPSRPASASTGNKAPRERFVTLTSPDGVTHEAPMKPNGKQNDVPGMETLTSLSFHDANGNSMNTDSKKKILDNAGWTYETATA